MRRCPTEEAAALAQDRLTEASKALSLFFQKNEWTHRDYIAFKHACRVRIQADAKFLRILRHLGRPPPWFGPYTGMPVPMKRRD